MAGEPAKYVTESIKEKALSLGFDLVGIARSRRLLEYENIFTEWRLAGMNGNMNYLQKNTDARFDPSILLPGTRTVIVTGLNYYTDIIQEQNDVPLISRYAFGNDYHFIIKNKLNELLLYIKSIFPDARGKAFCDSSAILEKAWAVEAGLGWQGKNSLVINESFGSFFFIGILLLDIDLDYDEPFHEDKCGSCSLCIDHCPVRAINKNRTVDARKCISSLTIEKKEPLIREEVQKFNRRVFGCDICQEVCPWNKNIKSHNHPELYISDVLRKMKKNEWLTLDRQKYEKLFRHTPVARVRFEIFKKNIETVLSNPA